MYYIDSMEKRNTTMMTFKAINENTVVATNALREVQIYRIVSDEFDRNEWMVYTPKGRLDDDVIYEGPFASFDAARRDAEANVGFNMNWPR